MIVVNIIGGITICIFLYFILVDDNDNNHPNSFNY